MYAKEYGWSMEPVSGASSAPHTIMAKPRHMKDQPQQEEPQVQTVQTKLAVIGEFLQDQLAQVRNLKDASGMAEVKVDIEKWLENLLSQVSEQKSTPSIQS